MQAGNKGEEIVKSEMDKITLMYIADGAAFMLSDLYNDDSLSEAQKLQMGNQLASIFPGAFDVDKLSHQKVKPDYKYTIKEIYKNSKHPDLSFRKTIYNLGICVVRVTHRQTTYT